MGSKGEGVRESVSSSPLLRRSTHSTILSRLPFTNFYDSPETNELGTEGDEVVVSRRLLFVTLPFSRRY